MMRKTLIVVLACMGLAACGEDPNAIRFDGQVYRGKAKAERGERDLFTVSAGPASASLDGAVQAAEYEAVKYCIKYLGTSEIAWVRGPDTVETGPTIEGDRLVLTGRCVDPA